MNILMWGIQIILSIKLISTAFTHGLHPVSPAMQAAAAKLGKSSRFILRSDAVLMLAGALGLIIPGAVGAFPRITSVFAAVIVCQLLGSILLHIKYREKPLIFADIILAVLAAVVAFGRWDLVPF
jgi:hypothetical protein